MKVDSKTLLSFMNHNILTHISRWRECHLEILSHIKVVSIAATLHMKISTGLTSVPLCKRVQWKNELRKIRLKQTKTFAWLTLKNNHQNHLTSHKSPSLEAQWPTFTKEPLIRWILSLQNYELGGDSKRIRTISELVAQIQTRHQTILSSTNAFCNWELRKNKLILKITPNLTIKNRQLLAQILTQR